VPVLSLFHCDVALVGLGIPLGVVSWTETTTYLNTYTRLLFLAEFVLVPDPEQEVSRTEGGMSREKPRLYLL
jgi:hypothetical protein